MNFRTGLVLFLALVVFDGAVRKWVLPGSEQLVYIAKDVLLLGLFVAYVMRYGLQVLPGLGGTHLPGLLLAYVAITGLQVLNPSLPGLVLGLFGFKTHVLYAALIVVVPAAFRDTEQMARALRYMLVPMILVLAFGVMQFYLPIDHPLNRYVRGTFQDIATFGVISKVRITSTFSYISGMTVFIFFALCLSMAFLAAGRWNLRGNLLAYACLVAAAVVTPMTGARWIYYMVIVCLPLFLFGMMRSGMLQARFAVRIIVLSFVGVTAVSSWAMEAFESLEYRRQSAQDAPTRVESLFMGPIEYAGAAGLLGYGAGATHQAAPALVPDAGFYTWIPVRGFEDEPGRIMLELGIVGFIVAFALRVYLCRLAWVAMMAGGSRTEKAMAGAALIFFIAHLISPVVFNPTGGALYWLFAGVVATILRDQHARRAADPELRPGAAALVPPRVPQ